MDEDTMAPQDAARELRAIARYDLPLRQRMEGVLWIVSGLTLTSLFFSYAYAIVEDLPAGILAVLWLPWALAGLTVIWGLRRSLALVGPVDEGRSWTWLFVGLAGVGLFGFAAFVVGGREVAPSLALVAVGVLALVPTLVPAMGYTPLGRRVGLVLGAIGIVCGLGVLFAGGGGSWGTWTAAAVCLAWVAGGAYQVVQG